MQKHKNIVASQDNGDLKKVVLKEKVKKAETSETNKGPYSQSYWFFQQSCMDVRHKEAEQQRIDALKL